MSKFSQFYKDYMRSPAWQRKREKVLKRDNYTCQSCLEEPANDVHHKSYLHFGNEPLFDLVSVGLKCHQRLTMIAKRRIKATNTEQIIEQLLLSD